MTEQEKIATLLETNKELVATNKSAVEINKDSLGILKTELAKNAALLKICGKTHAFLNTKTNKTWEEEEICRIIYSEITGIPAQPIP